MVCEAWMYGQNVCAQAFTLTQCEGTHNSRTVVSAALCAMWSRLMTHMIGAYLCILVMLKA